MRFAAWVACGISDGLAGVGARVASDDSARGFDGDGHAEGDHSCEVFGFDVCVVCADSCAGSAGR